MGGGSEPMKYKIKTATACYTGGGLYIYYGQLESGLYFSAYDEWESVYICDADTSVEEAQYETFYDQHTVEELTKDNFRSFWNAMLLHIINGGLSHGEWHNYLTSDLEERIIK
jgi:hypothetical protein